MKLPRNWFEAGELFAVQAGLLAVGLLLAVATPLGFGFAVPMTVLALLFGAWGWAMRIGRPRARLEREVVKALSWRVGVVWGGIAALAHALVATELPLFGRVVVPLALGSGAAFAALVMTLCGLDLGRPRER